MVNQVAPIFGLPAEVIQHIASLLDSDADLLSFAFTCHWLAENVLSSISGVWRRRFEEQHDDTAWKYPSDSLKIEYETRSFVLAQRVFARPEETAREHIWLEVIQTMLLEAYAPSRSGAFPSTSKNMLNIAKVVRKSNFLNRPMVRENGQGNFNPSDLFCAVQLCLTHLCLDPHGSQPCLRSNYDIAQVYSYGDLIDEPLIQMDKVRLEALLHIRNFWQRHLLSSREQTFISSYSNAISKPKEWNRPLEQIEIPTGCWHGYYSCIHPFPATVEILQEEQTCAGPQREHEAIKMFLVLETCEEPLSWSNIFNETFPIMDDPQPRVFFAGTQGFFIADTVFYRLRGFFEVIPKPQGEIPGWVRICFVSYIKHGHDNEATEDSEEENWTPDLDNDFESAYGFEGVLLPGGKIMLGQYFDMQNDEEECERGPCIYWEDSREKDLAYVLDNELL